MCQSITDFAHVLQAGKASSSGDMPFICGPFRLAVKKGLYRCGARSTSHSGSITPNEMLEHMQDQGTEHCQSADDLFSMVLREKKVVNMATVGRLAVSRKVERKFWSCTTRCSLVPVAI
jgi:hypothetical protein